MSFSGVGGGFQGGNALLAFAAIQKGRLNEEMTESMPIPDLRSQMAGDLADIKAHLEQANRDPKSFPDVAIELQAFMDKYGGEPELGDVTSTVGPIATEVQNHCDGVQKWNDAVVAKYADDVENWKKMGGAPPVPLPFQTIERYDDKIIQTWLDNITQKLDAAGTNDQLAMIHIKQLNDNINNSSGMVSGIIESRNNSTASIINNIA